MYICNLVALKKTMLKLILKSDTLGAIASILCLIHCSITPIVFLTWTSTFIHTSSTNNSWWYLLDYIFIIISFLAILKTTKQTNKSWMKHAFWYNWLLLLSILMNEKTEWLKLPEELIYIPTISILLLHSYSLISSKELRKNSVSLKPISIK